jgi:hypothetical protein
VGKQSHHFISRSGTTNLVTICKRHNNLSHKGSRELVECVQFVKIVPIHWWIRD